MSPEQFIQDLSSALYAGIMKVDNLKTSALRLQAAASRDTRMQPKAPTTTLEPTEVPQKPDIFAKCKTRRDVDEVLSKLRKRGIPVMDPMPTRVAQKYENPDDPYLPNLKVESGESSSVSLGREVGEAVADWVVGLFKGDSKPEAAKQVDGWNIL